MEDFVNRQKAIDEILKVKRDVQMNDNLKCADSIIHGIGLALHVINYLPSERSVMAETEIMPDGTIHVTIDRDTSKISRVLLSQMGTHFGSLYYAD